MIAIIDYKAGNLTSVLLACEYLGYMAKVTSDPNEILVAERVIFPGDGAARSAMTHLRDLGLEAPLRDYAASGLPFLGICLGTQIILEYSDENEGVDCLGLLPGTVKRFQTDNHYIKIPQMGWNTVRFMVNHPLFSGIEDNSEFYFIHSYYPAPSNPTDIWGETEYAGVKFAAIMGRGNVCATQFHPERSGRIGLQLLKNFLQWDGRS